MSVGTAKAKQSKARGQNRAGQDSSFFSPIAIGTVLFFFLFTVLFFILSGSGLFLIDFAFDFRLDSHYRTVFGFSLILSVCLSGFWATRKRKVEIQFHCYADSGSFCVRLQWGRW